MEIEHRDYQIDIIDKFISDILASRGDIHPVAAVPTGAGKTIIIGGVVSIYLENRPKHNVLILSHTETILLQDYKTLAKIFPKSSLGLYSSGLNERTLAKITVAGIQSVYNKAKYFKDFNLVIIDEAHAVPTKGNGMYRKFIKSMPKTTIFAGLSGSIFRTGHGYIYEGEGALFNKLSVDYCTLDSFNKLVTDGYLSPLYSKPPELQFKTDSVKISAGDYNLKSLSEHFDRDSITKEAVAQIIKYGQNYHSWLIFAIDIEHAEKINDCLHEHDIESVTLHSDSDFNRHRVHEWFVEGKIRALVSVGMITTGFDAPNIDLIALMRPTKSPVLHVQMCGRGLRIHPSKTHCLVLDFAGNTERLGPINCIEVSSPKKKGGTGHAIVKTCPVCGCLHHPTVKICGACGHEFVFQEKLQTKFSGTEIVKKKEETKRRWMEVTGVHYSIHVKQGKIPSLRVKYYCGLYTISEYVCYGHTGYPKYKANNWVKHRWPYSDLPPTLEILYQYCEDLKVPYEILVDAYEKYPIILDVKFSTEYAPNVSKGSLSGMYDYEEIPF